MHQLLEFSTSSFKMGFKALCHVSAVLVAFVACAHESFLLAVTYFSDSLITSLAYGLLSVAFSLLSVICIDIIHMNPADSFTWRAMLDHYGWYTALIIHGWWIYTSITEQSKDITKYQVEALRKIIDMNKTTDYGKSRGIDKVRTTEEFKKTVPFGPYVEMKDYIARLMDGDYKAFTNDETKVVVYTSGTTGGKKFFPWTKTAPLLEGKAMKEYNIYRRVGRSMGRTLMLFHTYSGAKPHPGKPRVQSMSAVAFDHRAFWLQPRVVFELVEEPSCLYATAIFGLREKELDSMKSIFSSFIFSFWVVIGNNWKQMCDDIERGNISHGTLQVDDETLAKINSYLTPDPERAETLRREFSKGMFRIARRIWPRITHIDMICTGALEHPAKLLQENQLYGLPFLSLYVSATEVISCANMDDELESRNYTLFPVKQFYEWVPEENVSEENPETLSTDELEVGKLYEMAVTTYCGIIRYRTGDILQCVGKYNQLPQFNFCYRYGQLLSLIGEKVTEKSFYKSLLATCEELKLKLVSYTVASSRTMSKVQSYLNKYTDPTYDLPHYILFCEFEQSGQTIFLSEEDKKKFDENLGTNGDGLYGPLRGCNGLALMKVFVMKAETFEELKALMIADTQTQQFKMPRVVSNPIFLEFLMNKIES